MISVIVPNYNHEKFLELRLTSIFNQTFQDFEVILLDDASTDNSVEILQKYSNHPKVSHFEINKKNSGIPFQQWKKGIELAKGEFIWIAESDDFCEIDFLQYIFQFMDSFSQKPGLVYTQSVDVNENGAKGTNRVNWTKNFPQNIWENNFSLPGLEFISKYLKVKNVIPNASAVVFRRDLVEKNTFNGIDNMRMCGDWLFWIRIAINTEIGFLAETLNYFRDHRGVSRKHTTLQQRKERIIEEAAVRRELKRYSIPQAKELQKLYNSWIKLFTRKEIFHSEFRRVLVYKSDYISLIALYIKTGLILGKASSEQFNKG